MNQNIIYKEENDGKFEILGLTGLSIFWLIVFLGILQNFWLGAIGILISIFLYNYLFKLKFNYKIKHDRIEFFSLIFNKFKDKLMFSDIDQVRFEDDFKTTNRGGNKDRIFIYPKVKLKNLKLNKSGYIPLIIGAKKEEEIVEILNLFKNKNIDVRIKTYRKFISEKTGINNWDKVIKNAI